ncbi:MAG: hypothetical protein HY813_00390 [Candidatus Portnoybacteria bacterium]|nr:hypothetical protein [Candidatus Portnoybacteria bacterium]
MPNPKEILLDLKNLIAGDRYQEALKDFPFRFLHHPEYDAATKELAIDVLLEIWKKKLSVLKNNTERLGQILAPYSATSLEIFQLRNEASKIFHKGSLRAVCASCRGECCGLTTFQSITLQELLYFLLLPFPTERFQWPEPHWQFIKEEFLSPNLPPKRVSHLPSSPRCLFLADNGCLLQNWKSETCLFYTCDCLEEVDKNIHKQIEQIRIAVREKLGKEQKNIFKVLEDAQIAHILCIKYYSLERISFLSEKIIQFPTVTA